MAWLAAGCALRFFRLVPAVASMAVGDNVNELQASLWRCLGLPLMAVAAAAGYGLVTIAACAAIGEAAAVAASLCRFHRRHHVPWSASVTSLASGTAFLILGLAVAAWSINAPPWLALLAGGLLTMLAATTAVCASPDARALVQRALRHRAG
jgi:peptidoglycan/LPS O-acetylase OafA/YrhL